MEKRKQKELDEKNEEQWKNELNQSMKKASLKDIARLTDRLSVPKNYQRMRNGTDLALNDQETQMMQNQLKKLPYLAAHASYHQEKTLAEQKHNFEKLMSLDFGNKFKRRRQFQNRTEIDNYNQAAATSMTTRTKRVSPRYNLSYMGSTSQRKDKNPTILVLSQNKPSQLLDLGSSTFLTQTLHAPPYYPTLQHITNK